MSFTDSGEFAARAILCAQGKLARRVEALYQSMLARAFTRQVKISRLAQNHRPNKIGSY